MEWGQPVLYTDYLVVRCEPEVVNAVDQLAEGNGFNRSEMARHLVRRGIRAVVEDNGGSVSRDPHVTRRQDPSPVDDAVLVAKALLRGDRDEAELVLLGGDTVKTAVVLGGLATFLLNRDAIEGDADAFLDEFAEGMRPKKRQIRVVRTRA